MRRILQYQGLHKQFKRFQISNTINETVKPKWEWVKQNYQIVSFVVSVVSGFIGWTIATKREQKRLLVEFPEPSLLNISNLFESQNKFKIPTRDVPNGDVELIMERTIHQAHNERGIFLIHGENGLGKTTALKKVLNEGKCDFIYISLGYSLSEITKHLVPETKNKPPSFPFLDYLKDSLQLYGKNREKRPHLIHNPSPGNAVVVIDNVGTIPEAEIQRLFILAKSFLDDRLPISFIFMTSEDQIPIVFNTNISKMNVIHVLEPDPSLAYEYLHKIQVPEEYHDEVVNITGSLLKYLQGISGIDKSLEKKEFVRQVKSLVYSRIIPDTMKWLRVPQIQQICSQILRDGGMTLGEYEEIVGNKHPDPSERAKHWSYKCLNGLLFTVEKEMVNIQNRALKNFIKEYLRN